MVTISLVVPEDKLADVYAAVAKAIEAEEEDSGGDQTPAPLWKKTEWCAVLQNAHALEEQLLRRLADARGRRMPMSELAHDLGLPADADVMRDFPALSARSGEHPSPVVTGGESEGGWYWTSPENAAMLRSAFEQPERKEAPSGSGEQDEGATDKAEKRAEVARKKRKPQDANA